MEHDASSSEQRGDAASGGGGAPLARAGREACPASETGRVSGPAALPYTQALAAACAGADPVPALGRARRADPASVIAATDHALLGAGDAPAGPVEPGAGAAGLGRWARQHVEIARALARGDVARAEALLRDHAGEFGCDPILLYELARRLGPGAGERLADLRHRACTCAGAPAPSSTAGRLPGPAAARRPSAPRP
jgi:hypothetical protein